MFIFGKKKKKKQQKIVSLQMLLNDVFPVIASSASWLTTKRNYSLKFFGTKNTYSLKEYSNYIFNNRCTYVSFHK